MIFLFTPAIWYATARIRDLVGFDGLIDVQIVDNSTYVNQFVIYTIFLFLMDFFQYWWHRAQHHFPVLWDQHVIHHSDEAISVTTATRHHWTEFILQAFTVGLPLTMLFKITPANAGIVATLFGALQFYLHSCLRVRLGPLSWLFSSPQMHRIHHSRLAGDRDKNFAAYFPIWDVIFGTYRAPVNDQFPPSGVEGIKHDTVLSLSIHPFVMWGNRLRKAIRASSRVRS